MNYSEIKPHMRQALQGGVSLLLNRAVFMLTGVLVFFNPFPHTTAIKEISFYLIVALVIFLVVSKKSDFSFRSPLTVPFVLYVLWAGASAFWAVDVSNTIHDVYAHLLKCIAIYYVIINYYDSERRVTILTWIIIISTAIFAIKGMTHFYILMDNPLKERLIHSTGAPINSSAILNLFSTLLAFFFLTREKKWFWRALLFMCFMGTFMATLLSYSRAALIALIISVVVLLISHREHTKKIVSLIAIISLAAGSLYLFSPHLKRLQPQELLKDFRIGIYYTCLEIFKDHPITGVGFGGEIFEKHMWNKYNPKIPPHLRQSNPFQSPHGFVFAIMVRLGLVGLIIFGFLIIRALQINRLILGCKDTDIKRWGAYLLASFSGMLVAGFFGSLLHGAAAYNFYILLAMITILSRRANETADDQS